MTGRTPCAVVGCRRSKKGVWAWWLCRDHYSPTSSRVRRRHARLKAALKRKGEIEVGEKSWRTLSGRATAIMDLAGRAIIRDANRKARGL